MKKNRRLKCFSEEPLLEIMRRGAEWGAAQGLWVTPGQGKGKNLAVGRAVGNSYLKKGHMASVWYAC